MRGAGEAGGSPEHRTGWLDNRTAILLLYAIALNYHRDHSAMSRSLAIVKTRASNRDPAMRLFSIGPDGISLEETAIPRET